MAGRVTITIPTITIPTIIIPTEDHYNYRWFTITTDQCHYTYEPFYVVHYTYSIVTIPTQWSLYLLSGYYTYSMVTLTTQHLTHKIINKRQTIKILHSLSQMFIIRTLNHRVVETDRKRPTAP